METEKTPTENRPDKEAIKRFAFLPFKVLLKLLSAVLLLIYILVGVPAAKELYYRTIYRAQDISSLYTMIDDMVQQGHDSKAVTAWIKARPLAETDKLADIIAPKSAPLGFDVFFELSRRHRKLGRTEEALFWMELGRFRLSYDIIRCGAEPEAESLFEPIFKRMHSPETYDLINRHPEVRKKITRRVLDFDEKYPAHDNPESVCKVLTSFPPADEINWESYRRVLRQHMEESLKDPDKAEKQDNE